MIHTISSFSYFQGSIKKNNNYFNIFHFVINRHINLDITYCDLILCIFIIYGDFKIHRPIIHQI